MSAFPVSKTLSAITRFKKQQKLFWQNINGHDVQYCK